MTKIVTTNSFRGGTGKSTIISNIAAYLASFDYKVVIVDGDLISPGVHAIFGLENVKDTITDYITENCELDDIVYDISEDLNLPQGRLSIVPASLDRKEIAEILIDKNRANLFSKAVKEIAENVETDFLLIDTHPGLNEEFLAILPGSDILINVVRPDNQDYQGLGITSQVSSKLRKRAFVLLNKVHKSINTKILKKQLESKYNVNVAGFLPFSESLMLAQSKYVFIDKWPEDIFSYEMQKAVDVIMGVKPKSHLERMYAILSKINKTGSSDVKSLYSIRDFNKDNCRFCVDGLLEEKFLVKHADKIKITDKGRNYLSKYSVIRRFVEGFRI
ncbi:MinD/ParA family protein [Candidatus Woesearchaeota archaeon]|nr:MinD/ParA family protein [Candidatus Woesearchaeota archaeon]